jgi:hypothetical protein
MRRDGIRMLREVIHIRRALRRPAATPALATGATESDRR